MSDSADLQTKETHNEPSAADQLLADSYKNSAGEDWQFDFQKVHNQLPKIEFSEKRLPEGANYCPESKERAVLNMLRKIGGIPGARTSRDVPSDESPAHNSHAENESTAHDPKNQKQLHSKLSG